MTDELGRIWKAAVHGLIEAPTEGIKKIRKILRYPTTRQSFEQGIPRIQVLGGNKIPTRCNRGFYCRSYCLLNMFRASLCPSSGAQEYYTVVAACVFRAVKM